MSDAVNTGRVLPRELSPNQGRARTQNVGIGSISAV